MPNNKNQHLLLIMNFISSIEVLKFDLETMQPVDDKIKSIDFDSGILEVHKVQVNEKFGNLLVIGLKDGTLHIYDVDRLVSVKKIRVSSHRIESITIVDSSKDSKSGSNRGDNHLKILCGTFDKKIVVIDVSL